MNKYGNLQTTYNGRVFDSKREARRFAKLELMERAGLIQDLRCQVRFELIPKIGSERAVNYIADFVYTERGKTVVEDAKGCRTDVYRIKRKLMLYRYGITIKET
ncbi:DUF1064 domain-containing protein [Candidatus Saccharibacteria bacterium]|nr:DUF1064 domain-containing protein [Candidatus Saccharibacteria bacterium]